VRQGLETALARLPIRSIDMTRLLDTLLVCAVLTILIVRTQLYLTNYPQLGGRGLHIAHLLWGGLLMLVAIGMLLAFVSPAIRQAAAVVGGVGLGLFIDELGKFVTADNNYFFKPTAAIIYCFFILFFLAVRHLDRRKAYTPREYLVNVIELLKQAALHDMDKAERRRALALLAHADPADPFVADLRSLLDHVHSRPAPPPSLPVRAARRMRAVLLDVIERPRFPAVVSVAFAVWAAASLIQIVALIVFAASGFSAQPTFRLGHRITSTRLGSGQLDFIQWADFASSVVVTALVLVGLVRLRQGIRAGAFLMFERALLVSLFFTQVFAFVHSQFAAVFGFLLDLGLFVVVRAILTQDLERDGSQRTDTDRAAAAPAGVPA
jgi:hypothetical protein